MTERNFDAGKCLIPTSWCGKGPLPKDPDLKSNLKYTSIGTRDQCVQKGFGVGMYTERAKHLPEKSLQKIKYVGEVFEQRFIENGIRDTDELLRLARRSSSLEIETVLTSVCTKKGKGRPVDYRAYNQILLWLYSAGVPQAKIPSCQEL